MSLHEGIYVFLEPLHVMIVALLALCFEGIGVKYIGCNECNYKYLVEIWKQVCEPLKIIFYTQVRAMF